MALPLKPILQLIKTDANITALQMTKYDNIYNVCKNVHFTIFPRLNFKVIKPMLI